MMEDEEIKITLIKAKKAETWSCVFRGHNELNPIQTEEVKKKLLLERFGEEHAGFDFSDAELSGNVPDPKTFLGGMRND